MTFLLLGTLPVVIQFGGDGWGVGPLRLTQECVDAALHIAAMFKSLGTGKLDIRNQQSNIRPTDILVR